MDDKDSSAGSTRSTSGGQPRLSTSGGQPRLSTSGRQSGVMRLTPQQKADVLVEEYLVAAAEDAKNAPPPLPPPARGLMKTVLVAGLLVACAGVWLVALYAPIGSRAGLPACPEQRAAVLRLKLVEQAQAIDAYIERSAALPPSLRATGDSLLGVSYFPKQGSEYEIVARDREILVSYNSQKPLDEFVGDAISVLSRKCR